MVIGIIDQRSPRHVKLGLQRPGRVGAARRDRQARLVELASDWLAGNWEVKAEP